MSIALPPSSPYAQVQARLSHMRWLLILRTAARAVAVVAMALLALEIAAAFVWYLLAPATALRALGLLLPAGMGLTGVAVVAGVAWACVRLARLTTVAALAQERFPELGMRLTASLEAPGMAYCPPALRRALWTDTLGFLNRTPLGRMISVVSAVVWLLLALALVYIHVSLGVPELREPLLSRTPLAALNPPPALPATLPAPPAERAFFAALKILRPSQDFWATKIEAVPFSVHAASSHGLTNVRLQATVNGDQAHPFALQDKALPEDAERVTTGEVFLDELDLPDYSLVTVQALADAIKPDHTHVAIASQPIFIQIRPFRRDILDLPGMGGLPDDNPKLLMLRWLLEEEKKVLRQTAALGSALDPTLPAYDQAADKVYTHQKKVIDKAGLFAQGKIEEAAEQLDSTALAELQSAIDAMGVAAKALQERQWSTAQPPENKALAVLVNLLRHEILKIQKPSPNSPPGKPPRAPGPKDPQQVRQDKQKLDNLEQLARQQDAINQGSAALDQAADAGAESSRSAEARKLADRENELAGKTRQTNTKQGDEVQKELLSQAEQRMREQTENLRQHAAQGSAAAESPEPSLAQPGLEASRLLRQAAARQQAQQAAEQARQLRQMLTTLALQDQQLKATPAPGADEQKRMGQEVDRMAQALGQMAEASAAKPNVAKAMQQAQGATGQAAAQLGQGQGQAHALEASIEAVAQAHQEAVGKPAQLAELGQELQDLQRELHGLKNRQVDKNHSPAPAPQTGPEAAGEFAGQLAHNGPRMEAQLKSALGPSAGVKQFHEQMKEMLGAEKGAGTPKGTEPGSTQGSPGQGSPGQAVAANPSANGSGGRGSNGQGSGEASQSGRSEAGPMSPRAPVDPNVVAKLDLWIDTVTKLQTEINDQLKRQTPADLLRTMSPDDAPLEYRPLVNDYYNRLSWTVTPTTAPDR